MQLHTRTCFGTKPTSYLMVTEGHLCKAGPREEATTFITTHQWDRGLVATTRRQETRQGGKGLCLETDTVKPIQAARRTQ